MLQCTSSLPPHEAARSWSAAGVVHELSDAAVLLAKARDRALDGGRHGLAERIAAVASELEALADEVDGYGC